MRTAAIASLLVALCWVIEAVSQPTDPQREFDFHIARLPLVLAIQQFSSQSDGIQLAYLPNSPADENIDVGPISGRFTIDGALTALLKNTGLRFEWVNNRTIFIVPPDRPTDAAGDAEQLDPSRRVPRTRIVGLPSNLLVTGVRIPNPDISAQAPAPILSRRQLDALGVSTVAEALRYVTQQPYVHSDLNVTGVQPVELRGLGRDTTLVTINGRRTGGSSAAWDLDAFDLQTVPLAAVERIEIILDSIPMSIGADAIGGIVNIVLKNDFDAQPVVDVHYGTADGGGAERRASISAGAAKDEWHLSTVMDYFRRDQLLGEERERWRDQDYRRYGGMDWRSAISNPGNVAAVGAATLPGLSSRIAAVPNHVSGTVLTPDDFLPGVQNLDSLSRFRSVSPARERISVVASATVDVGATAFGELFYTSADTERRDLPAGISNMIVPASNPWNPFGSPVAVSFRPQIGARQWTTQSEYLRALMGVRGRRASWDWEFATMHIHDKSHLELENDLDPARVSQALAQTNPSHALNPFDDGPGGSRELLSSLIASPTTYDNRFRNTQVSMQTSGPLAKLPAGDISCRIGAEWRELSIAVEAGGGLPGKPGRTITSGFAEFLLPIASPASTDLRVSLSGRIDSYRDLGAQHNWESSLIWKPSSYLSARATYGTTFRPASLYELRQPIIEIRATIPDFGRNNQPTNITAVVGGNPDLRSTTAESWAIGLALTPAHLHNLNISMSFWHSRLRDRVQPILLQPLLTHSELFPGRVERADPTPGDIAAGLPGVLTRLDVTPGNVGKLVASGIDGAMSIDIDTRFGRLSPALSATWMDSFVVVDLQGAAPVERVGLVSIFGTIPRWHAAGGITWSGESMGVTSMFRFSSPYDDLNLFTGERNGRAISPQPTFDVPFTLQLDSYLEADAFWRGTRLTLGVQDLFRKQPPFSEMEADLGYDPSQSDLRGRFVYARVSKTF